MTDADRHLMTVFAAALEKADPADRAAYLDAACTHDPGLRERVEALLRAHGAAGRFLEPGEPPADPDRTADLPAEAAGAVIGPYKLVEPIGEGGMGTVFLAQQQEPVKRLVALKVVKPGMDSRQVLARFEAERQALALMDHPHIAKVLDAGAAPSGRPYFVMELVKGTPITKYCDDHRLTPAARLGLFVQVCQAVQHAHQKGVIHRDLKPSNVLVAPYDGRPVVKVIDFGVAKAAGQPLTDRTLVTGLGAVVGTPEYMSPEQAELNNADIDTRSDVYSLGVLLYELLTGTTPLTKQRVKQAALLEVLRVIREEEPPRPSTRLSATAGLPSIAAVRGVEPGRLSKLVRGELDWIVMKALEKDRARRYETANGLAQDVERYLNDEPVLACPPSAGYRFRKFARRNKASLLVAGLVLSFLVALGVGIGWAVWDRAAREADADRQQADRRAKAAGQVDLILAEVDKLEQEQKWPEALAAARRAEAIVSGGDVEAATADRVRERLKDLAFIDRLARIRMRRVRTLGEGFDEAGADRDYAQAFRDYGVDIDALAVETSIGRLKARPAQILPIAVALDEWAGTRARGVKKYTADSRRLVVVARGIDPDPLRDRLRSAWGRPVAEVREELRRLADSIDIRAQHPATLEGLYRALWRARDFDPAIRLLRDARFVYPGDFWITFQLGYSLSHQEDWDGAIRFYTAAVSIRPDSAAALCNLGYSLRQQKKLDEAIAAFRKGIELDPTSAPGYRQLGAALSTQGKSEEAAAAYHRAIDLDPKNPHGPTGLARTGWDLINRTDPKLRDPKRALELGMEAVALAPQSANAWLFLGWIEYRAGDWKAGIEALERSCKLQEERGGGNALEWLPLAMAHWKLGHQNEARKWYGMALAWLDRNKTDYTELRMFRAEAAALLGIADRDRAEVAPPPRVRK